MGWVGLGWVRIFQFVMGLVGSRLWKLAFFIHALSVYLLLIILIYWNWKQTQPCNSFDPFAELRDGTSTSGTENDTNLQFSSSNELAAYNAIKVPAASDGPLNFWRTVQQLSSALTSSPSCAGHFGQLCTIREELFVRGSDPHRPKNKTVGEQSGSCRTFTLGPASRHAGARVLTM